MGLKPAPKRRFLIFADCATHFCRRLERVTQWQKKIRGLRWMSVPDHFQFTRSLSVSAAETHATDRALFLFIQIILRPVGNPKCTEPTLRAFNSSFDYLCGSWYLGAASPAIDERLIRMKARNVDAARSSFWHIRGHREPRRGQGRAVPAGLVHFRIHMKLGKYLLIRCWSFVRMKHLHAIFSRSLVIWRNLDLGAFYWTARNSALKSEQFFMSLAGDAKQCGGYAVFFVVIFRTPSMMWTILSFLVLW